MSPKITYQSKRFGIEAREVVRQANEILEEYAQQGFDLTLRQLYYQFVARALIPNTDRDYKRLGSIVNDARLAGLIDWHHIIDRTRNLVAQPHWADPADVIQASTRWFRTDLWAEQPYRIEVWIEKDALVGVIQGVCQELDVPYFSCRGYTSQSEMWVASQRLLGYIEGGQEVRILHLGDHDPSGIDMTRDIEERVVNFICQDYARARVEDWDDQAQINQLIDEAYANFGLDRLALNREQVDHYQPPPNPAKVTDSRARAYIAEYGHESWELDALEPTVLAALIRDAVEGYMNTELFDAAVEREQRYAKQLRQVSQRWPEIEAMLDGGTPK